MSMNAMEFDGCSTLWFKKWEDFENFFTSPEYETNLTDDCKHFMDVEGGLSVFAGYVPVISQYSSRGHLTITTDMMSLCSEKEFQMLMTRMGLQKALT